MINDLANFLLHFMPVSALLKALAFLVMTVVMYQQVSDTPLAKWINRGFLAIMLSSIVGTWFTYYIAESADAADVHWPIEWTLIVFLNVLPLWVAFCYGMIVYHNYHDEATETKNHRDIRQQETQDLLDQATLANAETGRTLALRGNRLSKFGYKLDQKVTRIAQRQRVQDKEGVDQAATGVLQDATDVRQDEREHNQDERDKE